MFLNYLHHTLPEDKGQDGVLSLEHVESSCVGLRIRAKNTVSICFFSEQNGLNSNQGQFTNFSASSVVTGTELLIRCS